MRWFRLPRYTPARFILFCMLVTLMSTGPALLFVYHRTDRLIHDQYAGGISNRQNNLMVAFRNGGAASVAQGIRDRISGGGAAMSAFLLVDQSGRKIAGNLESWPPTLRAPTNWAELRLYREGHQEAEPFAVATTELPTGERLLVGMVSADRERVRDALEIAVLGALLLSIPIGFAAGIALMRFSDRRVNEIGNITAQIAAGDLSRRLEMRDESDATAKLMDSVNAMLARMEGLVKQLRFVTDALAHDLRSPLTRMRASLERLAGQPSDEARQQALEAISTEIDAMLRLIATTLDISRTEAGIGRENFAPFDLGKLLNDLCEMYQPLAEDLGIEVKVENPGPTEYLGNRQLVGRAVSNLIDNAIKYGASGGSIRLGFDETPEAIELSVADRGAGIPAHQRDEAMTKYRRLDQSRTSCGSGLGLAQVRAVARLHQGELVLEDNAPGLRAIVRLRREDRAADSAGR
jgi:signal transduction histidine kinase